MNPDFDEEFAYMVKMVEFLNAHALTLKELDEKGPIAEGLVRINDKLGIIMAQTYRKIVDIHKRIKDSHPRRHLTTDGTME